MPALTAGNADGEYAFLSGWKWWTNENATKAMTSEGWKLHVGGTAQTAQSILDAVLPTLRSLGLVHKFLPTTEDIANQSAEQTGKWFAIYPGTVLDAFMCVYSVDEIMRVLNIARNNVTAIASDIPVGSTAVFGRYGGYSDRKVKDPTTDQLVSENVAGTYKPPWILDPWNQYDPTGNFRFDPTLVERFPTYNTAYKKKKRGY